MDDLEKAIERLRVYPNRTDTNINLVIDLWTQSREVREAEREFIESYMADLGGHTTLQDAISDPAYQRGLRAYERLRELRKPKPRYTVRSECVGRHHVDMDGRHWRATFAWKDDAEAWAAAQEQRP